MFASLFLAGALQLFPIVVPLQKTPPQVQRDVAPIQVAGPQFAATCKDWDEWDKPAPPVQVFANTYYAGTCGISSILITGDSGDILIDAGTQDGANLIASNIRKLGFRLGDVRILLHTHEHFDHVGGMGRLQQLTGAQLYASPTAAKVFATEPRRPTIPRRGSTSPSRPLASAGSSRTATSSGSAICG